MFGPKRGTRALSVRHRAELPGNVTAKIVTWNVGNAEPDRDLTGLLGPRDSLTEDLVVLGLQECEYSPATPGDSIEEAKAMGHKALSKKIKALPHHFLQRVQLYLGDDYTGTAVEVLGEMKLAVFAHSRIDKHVHSYKLSKEATGLMHVVSNKGGIVASITVGDTVISFVSSHLAAHEGEDFKQRRNDDVREIFSGTKGVSSVGGDITSCSHHVIWMGDLNYRMNVALVDEELATKPHEEIFAEVSRWVEAQEWAKLYQADELQVEVKESRVMSTFREGDMSFHPTFKVERTPDLQYKSQRIPAYCDRILWRSVPGTEDHVQQTSLMPLTHVSTSDHKPVCGTFQIQVRNAVSAQGGGLVLKFLEIRGSELRNMDKTGASDPFIYFTSPDPLIKAKKPPVSSTKSNTLNPVYEPKDLPDVPLAFGPDDIELVKSMCVSLVLFDYDATSKNDFMGSVQIGLAGADIGAVLEFDEAVYCYGLPFGRLAGKYTVEAL
eukprot:m.356985 g.356985  ORF g.356985 m.356985 type:complete len:494 (+) comp17679_c0_seq1:269-1750(+)